MWTPSVVLSTSMPVQHHSPICWNRCAAHSRWGNGTQTLEQRWKHTNVLCRQIEKASEWTPLTSNIRYILFWYWCPS